MKQFSKKIMSLLAAIMMLMNVVLPTGAIAAEGDPPNLPEVVNVNYSVRLQFNTTDESKINLDGGLYVLVKTTVNYQDIYACVPVSNATQELKTGQNGLYTDVSITSWKNADGSPNPFTYTGDQDVSVYLLGLTAEPTNLWSINLNASNEKQRAVSPVLYVGDFVNRFTVQKYPTDEADRMIENVPDYENEITNRYISDVVTLSEYTETFPEYSLEYIMNQYNLIALGDSSNSATGDIELVIHCMGAVLCEGDLILSGGSGIADSEYITKPSVIGGTAPHKVGSLVATRSNRNNDVPLILGDGNTVVKNILNDKNTVNGEDPYNKDGDLIVKGDYIDWNRLRNMVKASSNAMANIGTGVRRTGNHYEVPFGSHAILNNYPANQGAEVRVILDPSMTDEQLIALIDSGNADATVITVNNSGNVKIPDVRFYRNGRIVDIKELLKRSSSGGGTSGSVEDGRGISVTVNMPNATAASTRTSPIIGHVIAPNAHVTLTGDYNGAIVAKSIYSNAEGHLFPFKGKSLIPVNYGFKAEKKVDGETPRDNYNFRIDRFSSNYYTYSWVNHSKAQNVGETITFKDLTYTNEDAYYSYYYIVYEDEDQNDYDDLKIDPTVYIIKNSVSLTNPYNYYSDIKVVTKIYKAANMEAVTNRIKYSYSNLDY